MSDGAESLADILSGSSAVPSAPQAEPQAQPEATDVKDAAAPSAAKAEPEKAVEAPKAEPTRDDSGRFAKTETKEKSEPMVPLSALLAERAKRREPETQKPKTSFLDDENKAFEERASETLTPIKEQLFEMSVEFARGRYDDFDEVAKTFAEAANSDERLWEQMRNSRNPAMYVYQVGKQFKELAPFSGDLLKYRESLSSASKAELDKANERINALTAELEAMKKGQSELESVPRSLNTASSGAQPTAADKDPDDISKIVRFGNS